MNETQWKHRLQYARDHYPPGTRVRLLGYARRSPAYPARNDRHGDGRG